MGIVEKKMEATIVYYSPAPNIKPPRPRNVKYSHCVVYYIISGVFNIRGGRV